MAASASASRRNSAIARSRPRGESADRSISASISGRLRCGWCDACRGRSGAVRVRSRGGAVGVRVPVPGRVGMGVGGRVPGGRVSAVGCAPPDRAGGSPVAVPLLDVVRPPDARDPRRNCVADTLARSTRSAASSYSAGPRLPSASRSARSGRPASRQRAEDHVAGGAVEAVEVEDPHASPSARIPDLTLDPGPQPPAAGRPRAPRPGEPPERYRRPFPAGSSSAHRRGSHGRPP